MPITPHSSAAPVVSPADSESDPLADSRRSLTSGVSARIEAMILGGELQPGQRINESHLGAALRVSRAPIREACRRLERHGLVEVRPNLGTFVCTLDAQDIADLYDIRIALEELVGRRAAEHIDQLRLAALHHDLSEMTVHAAAGSSREYYLANQRFHGRIVAAAGSPHLTEAYAGATKRLAMYRIGHTATADDLAASLAEHVQIIEALQIHDATACGRALADHCRSGYHRHLTRTRMPA